MPIAAKDLAHESFLRLLLMGPAKVGKAQPYDEPVLTPSGWRLVGDLVVGDLVAGTDGPTEVTGVFPQGRKQIVRVTADDGGWALCCDEHLWRTTTRRELDRGRYYTPRYRDRSRGPKTPTGKVGAGSAKTAALIGETIEALHYLPSLVGAVRFDRMAERLPLDPYYLGLLLGDGCFRAATITWAKPDEYLLDQINKAAAAVGDSTSRFEDGRCPTLRITKGADKGKGGPSATRAALIDFELDGLKSENKFIPPEYLLATPEERLALLRGLCDTDGSVALSASKILGSQCEYSTSSPRLRDDAVELVRSLGGRAYVRPKETDHLPAWSIMISFNDGTCPFQTPVKAELWKPLAERERFWRRRVESIEPVGEADCLCIKVAAADSMYVTRGHLLTHNTSQVIATSPGPVRVLLCEDISALRGAQRRTSNFDVELVTGWNSMSQFVIEAKEDAKAGKIKTVVVDPLSDFADRLLKECFNKTLTQDGKEDGRRAYPMLADRLKHLVELLFTIPAHVVVICHYMETGGDPIEGGLEKTGEGIVPLLPGKSRALVAAKFADVVWMDVSPVTTATTKKGERIFVTGPRGAWGPGCRSLEGAQVLPADIGVLLKAFEAQAKTDSNGFSKKPIIPIKKPTTTQPQQRK